MSYLLFMDESGHDLRHSPYEVLAGVCVEDRDLWNLICQVQDAEIEYFGRRIADGVLELKGRKLLKRKTFKLAAQLPTIPPQERTQLAQQCLEHSDNVTKRELTALAQAKIAFVQRLLELCAQYRASAFASIIDKDAPRSDGDFLRKDYAYLFERYFYFLEEQKQGLGLVVFDELDRSQCHLLLDQMGRYFRETVTGRMRASRVIPEPFFVHSELTTAIQIADIIAYIVAWGVRVGNMTKPARTELLALADQVCQLRYRTRQENFMVWSFAVIDDLRSRDEKGDK